MPKFEYKTLVGTDYYDVTDDLNELGNQGWELVSVVDNTFYLKHSK